jgi:8-oxo-dGTP pyrophosphatase MutT (NUDIX family)
MNAPESESRNTESGPRASGDPAFDSRIGKPYRGSADHPLIKPRDAASIILIDRSGASPRILVGKRGKAHAFMPNAYVFPGGRRDPDDSRIRPARPLREDVAEKLLERTGSGMNRTRAQALAVTAVRETMEEAGLRIASEGVVSRHPDWAEFARDGLAPDLSSLRYVARAITPPRQSRRFDTRFFACFFDEISAEPDEIRDSHELHDLTFLRFDDIDGFKLPTITRTVLSDIRLELERDSSLPFGRPVPFYFVKRGIFVRETI